MLDYQIDRLQRCRKFTRDVAGGALQEAGEARLLQQVAAGNPQLAAIISQNPEQFMQLLAEDGDEDVQLPPGAQQISVTEEEREAIERVSQAQPFLARDGKY